jgi:hypothetical protein
MKTKSIGLVSVLFLLFLVLTSASSVQEKLTFEGVYDGKEDYGYNFMGVNSDGDEYTMTFQNIEEGVLKSVNLNSDQLIGTKFSVTYTTKIEKVKDEDGYEEDIETNTIVAIKKL